VAELADAPGCPSESVLGFASGMTIHSGSRCRLVPLRTAPAQVGRGDDRGDDGG
jgi:hypothetical protein